MDTTPSSPEKTIGDESVVPHLSEVERNPSMIYEPKEDGLGDKLKTKWGEVKSWAIDLKDKVLGNKVRVDEALVEIATVTTLDSIEGSDLLLSEPERKSTYTQVEGISLWRRDSSILEYIKLLGGKILGVEDMPDEFTLPSDMSDYFRNLISVTDRRKGHEQTGFVSTDSSGERVCTKPTSGEETSAFVGPYLWRSFTKNPFLAFVHSHPPGKSAAPSHTDLGVFQNFESGALMNVVVGSTGIYVSMQTKDSLVIPISSAFDAWRTMLTVQSEVASAAVDGGAKMDKLFTEGKGFYDKLFLDDATDAVMARVSEDNGRVLYRLKGDIRDSHGGVTLTRVDAAIPDVDSAEYQFEYL